MKLSQLRVRMWHAGYDPRVAFTSTNLTPAYKLEVSYDSGDTWVEGSWKKTVADTAMWMLLEDIEIDEYKLVAEENIDGWRGQYELTFRRNGGSPPAAPLAREQDPPKPSPREAYSCEGCPAYRGAFNPACEDKGCFYKPEDGRDVALWITRALERKQPVSEPGLHEDISSYGMDPVHEAMLRGSTTI